MTDTTPHLRPVLVPFDGSAAAASALPYAAVLGATGAQIVLLQVIPEPHPIRDVLGDIVLDAERLLALTGDAATADLDSAEEQLRRLDPTLAIEQHILIGDAATAIVEAVAERQPQLVVATTRGRGDTAARELGSVAERLTGALTVPLLLVNPSATEPPIVQRFVVGLDGSAHASTALDVAAGLARQLGVPIHAVSVVETGQHELPPRDRPELLDRKVVAGLDADARRDAQRVVERAGAHLIRQGIHASWETPTGNAAVALMTTCRHGDILVIASHGQSDAVCWALGTVARRLVQGVNTATLLVRASLSQPDRHRAAAPEPAAPAN